MNKRIAAAIASVVLATFGIVFLLNYASAADERAYAGTELETVLQIQKTVPKGTPADELTSFVRAVRLPTSAVAKGAVSDLADLSGLVVSTDLEPGEQVLLTRFGKAGDQKRKVKSAVPKGLQEITIALSAQRVDSRTAVGDRVGVIASYEEERATNVLKNWVLVTRIDALDGVAPGADAASVFVTLAVDTAVAQKTTNAAEFGRVWLTKQSEATDTSGARRIEVKDILR